MPGMHAIAGFVAGLGPDDLVGVRRGEAAPLASAVMSLEGTGDALTRVAGREPDAPGGRCGQFADRAPRGSGARGRRAPLNCYCTRSIVTVFMMTGCTGLSLAPVLTLPIFWTTLNPSTTSPKIV